MGMDQDDIVLAPWTTIKYRVAGSSLANVNQSAAADTGIDHGQHAEPDLSRPGRASTRRPRPLRQADTPLPVRFANVDEILVAARSASRDARWPFSRSRPLLRERHRIRAGRARRFHRSAT